MMLTDNYLYTMHRDNGLRISLMHKCGTEYHFYEQRASHYDYTMVKGLIRHMDSMTDECCDQFLDCCGQATEAKKRAKQQAAQEAAAKIEAEKAAKLTNTGGPAPKTKEELAQIKAEKALRAAEKQARRAEKLKLREGTSADDTQLDPQDSV